MANFELTIPFTHEKEGGFVNDPHDAGGATNMGVTLNTYTTYCRKKGYPKPTVERLKQLSEAEWQEIMRTMYWDVIKGDDIQSQSVALAIYDWAVHSGPATAVKHVQRILGVKSDGIVGPITLAAINSFSPLPLFGQIQQSRLKFLESLCAVTYLELDENCSSVQREKNRKFLNGWVRRVRSIQFED